MHVLLEREGWSANINPTQMVSDRVGLDAHGLGNLREVHSFRPKPAHCFDRLRRNGPGWRFGLQRRQDIANGIRLPVKQLAEASRVRIRPTLFDLHQDLVADGFDARRQPLRRDGFAADAQLLAAVLDELVLLVAGGCPSAGQA